MTDLIELRVSNLIGAPLDWAVAKAAGFIIDPECRTTVWHRDGIPTSISIRGATEGFGYRPSTHWAQGGQLIDRHRGSAQHCPGMADDACYSGGPEGAGVWCYGPTALIAFCRGLVHYKLGDTVQVPKELMP
ncbi:phage protein NinX family protein [Pseudomonas monteilii]|uniref:phage protein NinX family protein n=1 Tax=Pseudomonas TaxID=286 RepID=UPI000A1FD8AB|nr:phage protein NinX family protein [Pseudomonas sp. B5(2017)]